MSGSIIALDIGEVRIGVASGDMVARFAHPYTTLDTEEFAEQFAEVRASLQPTTIVVGLPRNLDGNETAQTTFVRQFVDTNLPDIAVIWQDEALTSVKAKEELESRGKAFVKKDVDALAATYILQDYFDTAPKHAAIKETA